MSSFRALFSRDDRRRRLILGAAIYAITTSVYFGFASRQVLSAHTPWNHFALLADCWLHGRLDLGGPPPGYAGNNDFAEFRGKWYVAFPPFPAVLLVPLVKLAGSVERVMDGQFFLWLAGIGPAVLFLGLEKLRRMDSGSGAMTNVLLALLFAFGTVYFFTAEQGTVWFAAHVVAVALAAGYLLFALEAERPLLAGLMLGLGWLTRSPLLFAFPLFLFEAFRVCARPVQALPAPTPVPEQLELPLGEGEGSDPARTDHARAEHRPANEAAVAPAVDPDAPSAVKPVPRERLEHRFLARPMAALRGLEGRRFVRLCVLFAIPITLCGLAAAWNNHARFGDPFEFGYRYLAIAWRGRVEKWGLFDYHYLARNLGVVFTSLPFVTPGEKPPFQINAHGLALWFTTPAYIWLLWPRRTAPPHLALWLTVLFVSIPTLFYQNTGWLQFGYRFSNDYSVFLFALLATGAFRFRALFWAAGIWAVAINAFGAKTFGRSDFQRYYYQDHSQKVFYQPD
jgi:hypothetical protein